jgi:HEAT repeat protein
MKTRTLCAPILRGFGSAILVSIAFGHGGTYRGPGDTVPAGGGGGGGSGGHPTGPSGGNPSGPTTGNPSGGNPGGTPGQTGGPGARGAGGVTGGASGKDLTSWEFWWNFNKEQFLGLRQALYRNVETGNLFGDEPGRANMLVPSELEIREKIVPALQHALATERQNDIVTGSLVALAKIGDARAEDGRSAFEDLFKTWLPDSTQEITETAAVALGILASDSSVHALTELARDSDAGRKIVGKSEVPIRTRAFAAYGLGLVGARSASNQVRQEIVDALCGLLEGARAPTRDVQVAALISIGLTPVDWSASAELAARRSASASRRAEIEYVQGYFTDEANEPVVRAHAPGALAHLLTHEKDLPAEGSALRESVLRSLAERLGEHSSERELVRQSCILAIGELADLGDDGVDSAARAEVRRMAEHGLLQERAFALIALGQVCGRPGHAESAAQTLNQLRGVLVEKLSGGSTALRPWAALGLGISERAIEDLGSSSFVPSTEVRSALRTALRGAGLDIVGAYAVALGIARDSQAQDLLHQRLKDVSDGAQRGYVALALGMIGANGERATIQKIVRESKYAPELLQQAAIALGLLGDKSLVPELVEMLNQANSTASRAAVASALGFIGDARSIDPLVRMLQDTKLTASARGFAAVALGIVADKEPLPWNAKVSIDINYLAQTSTLTTTEGTGLLDIL